MQKIEIYTDGSSLGNPGPGGWGVVVTDGDKTSKEFGHCEEDTTNNRMELTAAIEAVKYANNESLTEVTIHADSAYVLGGITQWVFNWERNGWRKADKKPVLNQDLWQELLNTTRVYKGKITWAKVKGHAGHVHNERADAIATTCASKQKKF